ncbi:transposase [Archangium gephyra]|nr:transposase [Archangium gephyra]
MARGRSVERPALRTPWSARCGVATFATYALGLLSEGERKSVEPIAARATGSPVQTDAAHQRLLHFLADSDWDDHAVRLQATQHALKFMAADEPIEAWILDDTGFLRQGTHSVGVQRQYTVHAPKEPASGISRKGVTFRVQREHPRAPEVTRSQA